MVSLSRQALNSFFSTMALGFYKPDILKHSLPFARLQQSLPSLELKTDCFSCFDPNEWRIKNGLHSDGIQTPNLLVRSLMRFNHYTTNFILNYYFFFRVGTFSSERVSPVVVPELVLWTTDSEKKENRIGIGNRTSIVIKSSERAIL